VPQVVQRVKERSAALAEARNTSIDHGPSYLESWIESAIGIVSEGFRFEDYVGLDWIIVAACVLASCLMVFGFINVFALFAVWLERKVSAHMQCRLGPMEVGPHGALQTIADGLKLIAKEDIIPRLAHRPLFALAPMIVFAGVLIRFVPLPFSEHLVASDMALGLFFIAAVGSTEVLGVVMAGWASNNKWSVFATMRTAAQMVSYEIPIGLAFVTVIVLSGSFSLVDIVYQQAGIDPDALRAGEPIVVGWFWHWFIFRNPFMPLLMMVYIVASLAECKRAPFDLPEAESELVSGFHTEYSGMRFGLFFMAEYGAMYLVAAIAVVLYLGGWWSGIAPLDAIGVGPDASILASIVGICIKAGVLISKAIFLVFVQMWVRWTLPRIRLDQMMYVCWKVLTPLSLLSLVGATLWELASGGAAFFGLHPFLVGIGDMIAGWVGY